MQPILLVTGGSRGIGRATAIAAARQGYQVVVNYHHNADAAAEVVQAIKAQNGHAVAMGADVSSESDVVAMFARIDQELGAIDVLINNAGVVGLRDSVINMDAARLTRMFAVNITGSFLCAREAIKRMSTDLGGKGGRIVNVSSVASKHGAPGEYVDYAASKGAIDTMTLGLAKEVATQGIRVNAVRPGLVYTDIHAASGEPGRADRIRPQIPMQRVGNPEEVAAAILWLASTESSYSTGAVLDVAGGR
ncbi:MAG: SDR family oxidoreductase [Proteobacteria bacterium]|nr:SDR family oxidoreductase [Pseudomonadota bacterium]